jgi:hypothetical protein
MSDEKIDVLETMARLVGNTRTMAGLSGDPRMREALREGEKARDAVSELIEAADELKEVCNRPSAARTRAESWRRLDRALARVRSS